MEKVEGVMTKRKVCFQIFIIIVIAIILNGINHLILSGWAIRKIALLLEVQALVFGFCYGRYKGKLKSAWKERKGVIYGCVILEFFTAAMALRACHDASGFVRPYMALIFLLLMFAIFWFIILFFVLKAAMWKVYLVVAGLIGTAYMLLLPVYVAPDEQAHLWKAYAISDHILGVQITDENGYVCGRADDVTFTMQASDYDAESYARYVSSFEDDLKDASLTSTNQYCLPGQDYQYMAQAIGITIGRVLGWNTASTFLLGRWMGLLVFILLTSFAIATLPFGKMLLFGIALFPMTMQQAMSYSYDSFFMGVMFAVSALILKCFFSTERQLEKWEYVLLALMMLIVFQLKSHAYFMIALLPLCLWGMEILYAKGISIRRVAMALVLAGLLLGGITFLLARTGHLSSAVYNILYAERFVEYTGEYGYHIGYFIDHPASLYNVFMDTLNAMGAFYINSTIGRKLGWFEIAYPGWIYCGWVLFAFAIFITYEEKQVDVFRAKKWMTYIAVIIAALCVMAGMLLHWTPVSTFTIQGVQGRYFIPLLPLAFCLMRQRIYETRLKERQTGTVCMFGLFLTVMTVATVFDFMWS